MSSEEAPENVPGVPGVPASAASQPRPKARSRADDAQRKRDARAAQKSPSSSVGGRAGSAPRGNPIPPSSGVAAHMGDMLSPGEARDQLFYGHVGLAKVFRSEIDLHEMDEEFEIAGKNYAYVANHILTPLRIAIRFIAPLVLVAVLVVIWGRIIGASPYVQGVRDWWQRRNQPEDPDETPRAPRAQVRTFDPTSSTTSANGVNEPEGQTAPPVPRRPSVVRSMGYRF